MANGFADATLRAGGILAIPAVLADFGIDPQDLLADAGIDQQMLGDPERRLTYEARLRLLGLCASRTGCSHFGLLVGQRMQLNSLGLLGLLMKSMPSARDALRALETYFHVHNQGALVKMGNGAGPATLSYEPGPPEMPGTVQTGDGAVAMMLNIMRQLCGPTFRVIEASFARHRPADTTPYMNFFKAPLYFDAPEFAITFATSWLDVRLPGADPDLENLLRDQIESIKDSHSEAFPQQVKMVLRSALSSGHADEESVAALFGMSRRTLVRRMEAWDTTFRQLVDECRFESAQHMLATTSLSIQEIADLLGYTRSSVFIRSFRRLSGETPGRWRTKRAGLVDQTETTAKDVEARLRFD